MLYIEWAKEGGGHPWYIPTDKYYNISKMIGLLVCICYHVYSTGDVVILYTSFCVLQGIIDLRKLVFFASDIIKKRPYWPTLVPGDAIDNHLSTKDVGDTDSLKGKLDNYHYGIFCLKYPDYVMKIMST